MTESVISPSLQYLIIGIGRDVWLLGEFGGTVYRNFILHNTFDSEVIELHPRPDRYLTLTADQELFSTVSREITEPNDTYLLYQGIESAAINDIGLYTIGDDFTLDYGQGRISNIEMVVANDNRLAYQTAGQGYLIVDGRIEQLIGNINDIHLSPSATYHTDNDGRAYHNNHLIDINLEYGIEYIRELSSQDWVIMDRKGGLWFSGTDEMADLLGLTLNNGLPIPLNCPHPSINMNVYAGTILSIVNDNGEIKTWTLTSVRTNLSKAGWNEVIEINSYYYSH